jgi:cation diffusion facilitator family transporter
MSDDCCAVGDHDATGPFRRVLWIVLAINMGMFLIEAASGLLSGSVALQADALDFLKDSATYALTLMVLQHSLKWRASAAMIKGIAMAGLGGYVLAMAAYRTFVLGVPDAEVMSIVGVVALVANVVSAAILYRFREGDANVRSVWLCSRNDAIGNIAVIGAGVAVYFTNTPWPDLIVAMLMAWLSLWSAGQIIRHARDDLREHEAAQAAE